MKENNKQLISIFGKWWEPIRKWFYPTWLLYELSVRFYDYAVDVHNYFIEKQGYFVSYIGEIGTQTLAVFCSIATFVICTAFLTVSACFILYKFFKIKNLTDVKFEEKIKKYF
ncbi:hypothetical protein [Aquimarina muelleri]|uniref:Uncharacterized protein n=1 Tax=Aquimarina muelleri TaxID=279356 RepID=A0A918JS80_9FLAO|nr:hypothetical protein [Aquimarina muelleri]MCX2763106.1 hypothetical protein [Aquimarina muelleri]GGX06623.1 hypothetical protein GCM10007384_05420 [Aquimarina muelleri]